MAAVVNQQSIAQTLEVIIDDAVARAADSNALAGRLVPAKKIVSNDSRLISVPERQLPLVFDEGIVQIFITSRFVRDAFDFTIAPVEIIVRDLRAGSELLLR